LHPDRVEGAAFRRRWQNALRSLREKADLLEEGGNVIRFGTHSFRAWEWLGQSVTAPARGLTT
jgi:hypothetical protein